MSAAEAQGRNKWPKKAYTIQIFSHSHFRKYYMGVSTVPWSTPEIKVAMSPRLAVPKKLIAVVIVRVIPQRI